MLLSRDAVLVFVLRRSGCAGRLDTGRIERLKPSGLNVYNTQGVLNEYISGYNLRSWCVLGPGGRPIAGWAEVQPEDGPRIIR
jgi:hypothetical protein